MTPPESKEQALIDRANALVGRADDVVRKLDELVADMIDALTAKGPGHG